MFSLCAAIYSLYYLQRLCELEKKNIATLWLHLGFSAKLIIWQDGATIWYDYAPEDYLATHPPTPHRKVNNGCIKGYKKEGCSMCVWKLSGGLVGVLILSMLCGVPTPNVSPINKVCAVSPPALICFFPTQLFPQSRKYVRCPNPPLTVDVFSVQSPPHVVLCLCNTRLCL